MKITTLFTLVLLNIITSSFAMQATDNPTLPKAPFVTPNEVRQWQAQGKDFVFVDVREPEEFETGHIEGSINIPYAQVDDRLAEFTKETDTSYVIYCIHSSWRAPYVANLMADEGYENVYVLEGGVAGWNGEGQEIGERPPEPVAKKVEIAPYPEDLKKELKTAPQREYKAKINLTLEQLKEFDGKDGRPAYVAADGVIYDLTSSRLWRGGVHDPGHGDVKAGTDVTALLEKSPHGKEHFYRFPIVGELMAVGGNAKAQ